MSDKLSQERKILNHLRTNNSITPVEALNFYGCFRLGARIYNLKKKHEIVNLNKSGHARYALKENITFE